jgi:subfamily B ATP-binding cassette protein MsbA
LIAVGSVILVLTTLLAIPIPFLTKYLIDVVIPSNDHRMLVSIVAIISVTMAFNYLINYYQGVIFVKVNNNVVRDVRIDLLRKLSRVTESERQQYQTGYLISRINNDTTQLGSLMADTLVHIVQDIVILLSGVFVLLALHWRLAIVSFLFLPVFLVSLVYFTKKIRILSAVLFEQAAEATGQLKESLEAIPVFKLLENNDLHVKRYANSSLRSMNSGIRLGKISFLNSNISGFVSKYAPVVILGYGCSEIMKGRLTIGALVAFSAYVGYLFNPTHRLVNVNARIQQAIVALKRISAIFEIEEEKGGNRQLEDDRIHSIAFRSVGFSYGDKKVFESVSLDARRGQVVGIIGPSGAGKSTLLRLLTALRRPSSGELWINGVELGTLDYRQVRSRIAMVEQEPFLIRDTIRNNIVLGRVDASDDEVIRAAEQAQIHEYILGLDERYETELKEHGSNLSVGQKQRIVLARALLSSPDILVLDEPTSNLDKEGEDKILKTIHNLESEQLVFLVTHSRRFLKLCDLVVYLDEQGRSSLLMSASEIAIKLAALNAGDGRPAEEALGQEIEVVQEKAKQMGVDQAKIDEILKRHVFSHLGSSK